MVDNFQLFSKVVSTDFLDVSDKERTKVHNYLKNLDYIGAGINTNDENLSLSSNEMYLLDKPNLKYLRSKILNFVNNFMHNTMKYKQNDFKITTSWVAKTEPGNNSHWHNHNNCFYSGVYYVDTHENCGDLQFITFDNKRNDLVVSEYNQLNAVEFFIKPMNNRIVIFPSEVYHQVGKNKCNDDRYSIAFNIVPIGVIGKGDSQLVIN